MLVTKKEKEKAIQYYFNDTTRYKIPTLMRTLNRQKEKGYAITYKLNCSTLEDVYLKYVYAFVCKLFNLKRYICRVQNAAGSQSNDIKEDRGNLTVNIFSLNK